MEYSINLSFPFTGNTDHIIVSKDNAFDDIQEYIFEAYGIENFKIVSNSTEILRENFSVYDDMTLSIIPSMKSGRDIYRPRNVKFVCTCGKCITNNTKYIPNKTKYISPEVTYKYIRNIERDELENLGKKFRIAMEEEFKREEEMKKENQKFHDKIMDLRNNIRKSKSKFKKNLNGIKEQPKKPENDTFCGFKKGFLL